MGASRGLRSGTRYAFARGFKKGGSIKLTTYLTTFRVGDVVDVVCNGAVQNGMPYKYYHGKTGIVYAVNRSACGVVLYRPVGNRYIEKRINLRIEHIKHSRSREDFLTRVKENAKKKLAAKKGEQVQLKRLPAAPREAFNLEFVKPETIRPVAYETFI